MILKDIWWKNIFNSFDCHVLILQIARFWGPWVWKSMRVNGEEVHLCDYNPVMQGIMRVHTIQSIHYYCVIVCVLQYGWMISLCIVPMFVPIFGQLPTRTIPHRIFICPDEWFYWLVVVPVGNSWALFLSSGELSLVGSCPTTHLCQKWKLARARLCQKSNLASIQMVYKVGSIFHGTHSNCEIFLTIWRGLVSSVAAAGFTFWNALSHYRGKKESLLPHLSQLLSTT